MLEIWHYPQLEKKRELLDTVKARKLAYYYGHAMRKQRSCLGKELKSKNKK